jgi:hypothetical protein
VRWVSGDSPLLERVAVRRIREEGLVRQAVEEGQQVGLLHRGDAEAGHEAALVRVGSPITGVGTVRDQAPARGGGGDDLLQRGAGQGQRMCQATRERCSSVQSTE